VANSVDNLFCIRWMQVTKLVVYNKESVSTCSPMFMILVYKEYMLMY